MYSFHSLREVLFALSREQRLLNDLFEKRKIPYKVDQALQLIEEREDRLAYLLDRGVLRENGVYVEIDDQFLQFFEMVLEVNEEINTSYINDNIHVVQQNILYYLQENNENRKYSYLKTVKSTLRKIGFITLRNVVDLNRNIDNTFKTEPNFKIKISKLEDYDRKRQNIYDLLGQTQQLIAKDERDFFETVLDEDLRFVVNQLRMQINEAKHNLIEIQKQIIEYLNQIKYHSRVMERLRQLKYLKDQFELKNRTDIVEILHRENALVLEPKPTFPLRLSVADLQNDDLFEVILRVNKRIKMVLKPKLPVAGAIGSDYLAEQSEEGTIVNIEELKNGFLASGKHLFRFILDYRYPFAVTFEEQLTVFCQMVSLFEDEFSITNNFQTHNGVEYVMVYPK